MKPHICWALKIRTHSVARFVPGKAYRRAIGVKLIALLLLTERESTIGDYDNRVRISRAKSASNQVSSLPLCAVHRIPSKKEQNPLRNPLEALTCATTHWPKHRNLDCARKEPQNSKWIASAAQSVGASSCRVLSRVSRSATRWVRMVFRVASDESSGARPDIS